jgi:hypothetical protein
MNGRKGYDIVRGEEDMAVYATRVQLSRPFLNALMYSNDFWLLNKEPPLSLVLHMCPGQVSHIR